LGRLITAPATVISIRALRAHCSKCSIRELCLPVGLEPEALRQLDAVVTDRIGLKKGDTLYRSGEPFTALYAIRLGSCKTTVLAEDARAQVSGHHMLGDLLGLDGIAKSAMRAMRLRWRTARFACCRFASSKGSRTRYRLCSAICIGFS